MQTSQTSAPEPAAAPRSPAAAPPAADGVVWALVAVSIWVGWILLTRLGVRSTLGSWDIAALRFGTAGLMLAPVLIRRGVRPGAAGWLNLAIMLIGAGGPYILVANLGLTHAPAGHAGALMPGVMPLWVAILSFLVLRERPPGGRLVGLGAILVGVVLVAGSQAAEGDAETVLGDGLLLTASFMWGSFTLASRRAALDPLHATAIIAVVTALILVPTYLLVAPHRLSEAPWSDILLQAFYQGVMTSVVSLLAYQRAIARLGAARAAAFGALVPVTVLLTAIPLLGEWPTGVEVVGIVAVSLGVFLATRA